MAYQAIDEAARPPKNSFFFHKETALRIGSDLTQAAQDGMARGDPVLMEQFFRRVLDQLQRDNDSLAQLRRQAASFIPRAGVPVFERLLMSTPDLRAGVIGLHPLRPIPLHDHPGVWSAQRVLSGRLRVRRYDRREKPSSSASLALLERLEDRELAPGGATMVAPSEGNIHGLTALGRPAVILSVRTRSVGAKPGSWFLPVDPLRDSLPTLLCNRLSRPTV
jgi:hypothetical protein